MKKDKQERQDGRGRNCVLEMKKGKFKTEKNCLYLSSLSFHFNFLILAFKFLSGGSL